MKSMTHKCACCFPQASPGCGYKWYHLQCWHPALTTLAPHLRVHHTRHFVREFLHIRKVTWVWPLFVHLCWELQEHSYVCVSTLSSGAAAEQAGACASPLSGTFLGIYLIPLSLWPDSN